MLKRRESGCLLINHPLTMDSRALPLNDGIYNFPKIGVKVLFIV